MELKNLTSSQPQMVDESRLSIHHICGRGGDQQFPLIEQFDKDIVNVLYDADPSCLAQIEDRNKNRECQFHVFPYCFGDSCKTDVLNSNYSPETSSLREMNPNYASYYRFTSGHDGILSGDYRIMEQMVEVITLDHLLQVKEPAIARPDFLSIDAQGTELEILQGSTETLTSNILALEIEVEFNQRYEGQMLFGDVCAFLTDLGFHFMRLVPPAEMSPFRAPIGLRGHGFQVHSSGALFLRAIDRMPGRDGALSVSKSKLMFQKLAFIAIVFDQFEYALACLERANQMGSNTVSPYQASYLTFLSGLEECISSMPKRFPKTTGEAPISDQSKAPFSGSREKNSQHVEHNIRRIPIAGRILSV